MKTFFMEEYDGPDCEKNSGLKIFMSLSVGTRSNNDKYVLVQVYRRNPEWQKSRGVVSGLPGSISISLNLDTDEKSYDNYLLHLINKERITEDHWLILFVRRLSELLACTHHRKGHLIVNVLPDTDNMAIIRNSVQMVEPGQVGLTAALVSTIALTDVFNSLEDVERFARVTGAIDVVSPVSAEESECCEPKFSSVHSVAQSILTYTPPSTPEMLLCEKLECLFDRNLFSATSKSDDSRIRDEMLLDQTIRKMTPQGQFLRACCASGTNGFLRVTDPYFRFNPFLEFTLKKPRSKQMSEYARAALRMAFLSVSMNDLLEVKSYKHENITSYLMVLAKSYFLVLISAKSSKEIDNARKNIDLYRQRVIGEYESVYTNIKESSKVDEIMEHISGEIIANTLTTAYLLDKSVSRGLLNRSVQMMQESSREAGEIASAQQRSVSLGAVLLARFLKETLLNQTFSDLSPWQVSAEPVLNLLQNEQMSPAIGTKPVL